MVQSYATTQASPICDILTLTLPIIDELFCDPAQDLTSVIVFLAVDAQYEASGLKTH
jgi:hypothetical protein